MAELDFVKLPSDQRVTVWIGPSGAATGIAKVGAPTANELNNTGGTSLVRNASASISWNDTELVGVTDSEELNEPSLADPSSYVEFGTTNLGGTVSYYLPRAYDDNSNDHSLIYDLTEKMREKLDFAHRIDGDKPTTQAAANGDYVSVTRAMSMSESAPFTPGESHRRTVGYTGKGEFAHYTIVGPHTLDVIEPDTYTNGDTGRIRVEVQGRDYTNAVHFHSSNSGVVEIHPGGFYRVNGTGSAVITVTDEAAGTNETVNITVA